MRAMVPSFSTAATFVAAAAAVADAASIHKGHAFGSSHRRSGNSIESKTWNVSDVYIGKGFYDHFTFFDSADPTDGLVNYLSYSDARAKNLTHADAGSFVIRGDDTTVLQEGEKRNSVRVQSKKTYTVHVQIADIPHMPTGKGTWPAYWMTGADWPNNGELDIIEGANDISPNLQTLHTSANCTMPDNRLQKGTIKANNCDAAAAGNDGCGVFGDSGNDFGVNYNKAGGGYWATVRTETTINTFFWSHADDSVPDEVKNGADSVDPSTWGTPTATFNSDSCDLSEKFGPNRIVINLDFCGGFAGHTFPEPGGTPACEDFVRNNPSEFGDAYWKISSLRIYE